MLPSRTVTLETEMAWEDAIAAGSTTLTLEELVVRRSFRAHGDNESETKHAAVCVFGLVPWQDSNNTRTMAPSGHFDVRR